MANRDMNFVQAPETEAKVVSGSFVGADGANPSVVAGCIKSVVRTGEGLYTVTLKDSYPQLLGPLGDPAVVGAAGDRAFFATIDVKNKSATVRCYTSGDLLDDCAGKTIYLNFLVRNTILTRR